MRARLPRLAALLAAAAPLALAGCGSSLDGGARGRLEVVATTTQLGDVVRRIAGRDAHVTQILRPSTDPHAYEPRPSDVVASAHARVVFENGDGLDAWMAKILSAAGSRARVVDLAAGNVDRVPGRTSGAEASRWDPHWWHDPRNAAAAVPAIRDALARADPAARARFAARARVYLRELRALDAGIARCVAAIPAGQRKLVTDHDAFGAFARRYGIAVVGAVIPSQTTAAQPSAGEVARLIATIEREHVAAVFPERSVNRKLADAIARATGASSGYALYGDTLGPPGSPGATYLTMERANADAIVRGLTGGRRGCAIRGI